MERIGWVNVYTCRECGSKVVTVNRDDGTTPMFLSCKASESCLGEMVSAGYRVENAEALVVTHQWYKPKEGPELRKALRDLRIRTRRKAARNREDGFEVPADIVRQVVASTRQHIARGGLLLRAIEEARAALPEEARRDEESDI